MSLLAAERRVAIEAVVQACRACRSVFNQLVTGETLIKSDRSPVTVADFSAQAVVNRYLATHFPDDAIIGEESAQDLRPDTPVAHTLCNKVLELTNAVLPKPALTRTQLLDTIDWGALSAGRSKRSRRHWTLDPIDGTKGFLRGDQYAVCLALIIDGQVELGVMGCPNLPAGSTATTTTAQDQLAPGFLFIAERGRGAFSRPVESPDASVPIQETPIRVSGNTDLTQAVVCESVEAAHSSHSDAQRIGQLLGIQADPFRMDSQCKYACLARGEADIYLRLPTRADYIEKIWDHATGSLLVEEAGGIVTDIYGKPLDFSVGSFLSRNKGVIASSAQLHPQVLKAVQETLNIE
ncbi:3'(2'),5'-bisphosphate nucleotidase [Dimargaris cristalligena]|nr:3'(2'),5'-bisphosphate nucleotidase [Dimargaris cristalligena]